MKEIQRHTRIVGYLELHWSRDNNYIYRGIGNSSRAPFNAMVCPQAMRTIHVVRIILPFPNLSKGVDSGRPRQKEAFSP